MIIMGISGAKMAQKGEKMKEVRYPKLAGKMAERGITVVFLSGYLNISSDGVRRKLNGQRTWKLEEVRNLIKLFNCTFDELFGE